MIDRDAKIFTRAGRKEAVRDASGLYFWIGAKGGSRGQHGQRNGVASFAYVVNDGIVFYGLSIYAPSEKLPWSKKVGRNLAKRRLSDYLRGRATGKGVFAGHVYMGDLDVRTGLGNLLVSILKTNRHTQEWVLIFEDRVVIEALGSGAPTPEELRRAIYKVV